MALIVLFVVGLLLFLFGWLVHTPKPEFNKVALAVGIACMIVAGVLAVFSWSHTSDEIVNNHGECVTVTPKPT